MEALPGIIEKLTLVSALVIAVVYLWKAYQAAVDRSLSELKEALARCEADNEEYEKTKTGSA